MKSIRETPGESSPLGLFIQGEKANFALFSKHASKVFLGLFLQGVKECQREFPMHRTGDIWHIGLENVPEGTLYAYKCFGPYNEHTGDLFNTNHWLTDPYTKILETTHHWGNKEKRYMGYVIPPKSFDWGGDTSTQNPP